MLPPGASPLRLLHISDTHLTPGRHRLLSFIRSLDALEPDLVVNTGDSIAHKDAVQPLLDALGPLLDRPGVFVYGSNDLHSPVPKNPARYLWRTSAGRPQAASSRPALGRAGRQPGGRRLAERQQPARPDQGRRPGHRGGRGATTRTSTGTATTRSPVPPTRRLTCAWASCTHPSPRYSTGSPTTASTCCWPATPTAASSACRASARWSPTAASSGPGPAACTIIRSTATPGCTFPRAWARPPMRRSGSAAGRRQPCSRWSPGSARLLKRSAGCGAAWQRASFGTKRSQVQIRSPRPVITRSRCNTWTFSPGLQQGIIGARASP